MIAREKEHAVRYRSLEEWVPVGHPDSQAEGLRALLALAVVPVATPVPARGGRSGRGGHHRAPSGTSRIVAEHRTRFASFSVIGAAIFVMGIAAQAVLTGLWHMGAIESFVLQGIASVQVSFLLNYYWTWRDQRAPFWPSFGKFNAQKVLASVANLVVYAGLVKIGINYLAANLATTAVFTLINYVTSHYWVFTPDATVPADSTAIPAVPTLDATPQLHHRWPSVSVVVPCKDNAATIRGTVDSLLGQRYPWLEEVILVGSIGDATWSALADVKDPRLAMLEQEPTPGLRDPAVKRDKGIRKARGEVIALADSDIVMEPSWLTSGVTALLEQGGGVVAGGMRSIHDTFWGRFVDCNRLGAKTPRLPAPYVVTADNFGRRNRKPPITANVMFTRDTYDAGPLDIAWAYGYEDYEWFWRLAKADVHISFTNQITGRHHHRRSFRKLVAEYRRAAGGCAEFVKKHPDSPLARKRLLQAITLPIAGLAAVILAITAVAAGHAVAVGISVVAGLGVLMAREFMNSRTAESLTYPIVGGALGLVFTTALIRGLISSSTRERCPEPIDKATHRRSRQVAWGRPMALAFAAVLAFGAAFRFWQLSAKPGWQYDEGVYSRVATNVLQLGTLNEHIVVGQPWQPFLYQPPFYPLILARWFALTGDSIYHARVLGTLASLAMLTMLWRLLWKIHGPRAGLFATVPIVFDGWLMYIERISYMENLLMLIIVTGFLLYQQALDRPSWQRFALAGLVLGCAVIFKQTGSYVLLSVALCWLVLGRSHRGHLVLLAVAGTVGAAYVLTMMHIFDVPGHDWYIEQTMVQVQRTFGLRHSGGTLTSPVKALHLLAAEYRVFIPSLIVAFGGFLIAARRVIECCQVRSRVPLRGNALLFSWLTAGVIVFGLSSLKFPQYFALILIPAYSFLWTEIYRWDRPTWLKLAAGTLAVLAGLGSFYFRVIDQSDNAFRATQQYAATSIPRGAVVVTEETIGDLIQQPWCRVEAAYECPPGVSYAITWRTYLQSSFELGDKSFAKIMRGAVPVKSFAGFNGAATIWRIR